MCGCYGPIWPVEKEVKEKKTEDARVKEREPRAEPANVR